MSHKKRGKEDLDHFTYEPSNHGPAGRPDIALRLVTVEQEQRRLDARRRVKRAVRKLDLERRLQAVFGASQPARNPDTLN